MCTTRQMSMETVKPNVALSQVVNTTGYFRTPKKEDKTALLHVSVGVGRVFLKETKLVDAKS